MPDFGYTHPPEHEPIEVIFDLDQGSPISSASTISTQIEGEGGVALPRLSANAMPFEPAHINTHARHHSIGLFNSSVTTGTHHHDQTLALISPRSFLDSIVDDTADGNTTQDMINAQNQYITGEHNLLNWDPMTMYGAGQREHTPELMMPRSLPADDLSPLRFARLATTHDVQLRPHSALASMIRAGRFDLSTDIPGVVNIAAPRPAVQTQRPEQDRNVRQALVIASRQRNALALARVNVRLGDPVWFERQRAGGAPPTFIEAFADLPFIDPTINLRAHNRGVIRFVKPPFTVTKSEILSLLGRQAKVVSQPCGTPYHAVHIMMACTTGKTEDAYVEVESQEEAETIVSHFERRARQNRGLLLGRVPAEVVISSQKEMLSRIFEHAKRVTWNGPYPQTDDRVVELYPGYFEALFDGFLDDEQIALLIKWVSEPARSPFTARGPHRPYEAVITFLYTYPVYAGDKIRIKDRKRLWNVTKAAFESLTNILSDDMTTHHPSLSLNLLQQLVVAGLSFPIFSDAQKAGLVRILRHNGFMNLVYSHGMQIDLPGTHEFASRCPFLTLVRKPGVTDSVVRYFVNLVRQYDEAMKHRLSNDELIAFYAASVSISHSFEPFMATRVEYEVSEEALWNLPLMEAAVRELDYLKAVLTHQLRND